MLRLGSFVVPLLVVAAVSSCANVDAWTVTTSGDRNGLALDVSLRPTADSLRAETVVRNTRDVAVHLDTTQCGRVAQVFLARTTFEPEGEAYTFDSLLAHDDLVTEVPIGGGLDMALLATGYGDGGYPVHVGLDLDGNPTAS